MTETNAERGDSLEYWIAMNEHKTHRGRVMDFQTNPFQIDILKDQSLDIVVRKSVQCGISEVGIIRAMAAIDRDEAIFWVFPDENVRNRFVNERFQPTIYGTDYYQRFVKLARERVRGGRDAADAVTLKQLGQVAICMVGSNSPSQMREFVADRLHVEELDDCDQALLRLASDRLGASKIRGKFRVGNPSTEGHGIDGLYRDSTARRWKIKCDRCNKWSGLNWFRSVVAQIGDEEYELRDPEAAYLCSKCERPINRLKAGEWVAAHPFSTRSGYHVSQLFSGTRTIPEMFEDFVAGQRDQTAMMYFYNSVLGMGYHAEGMKLFPSNLRRIISDAPPRHVGAGCFIGADPGGAIHGTVLDIEDSIVKIFELRGDDKWAQLQTLLDQYQAQAMVEMDYDISKAKEFQAANPGRVFLCSYRSSPHLKDWELDKATNFVKVERTQTMDESHAAIIKGDVTLPRNAESIPGFFDQMCAPTRVEVKRRTQHGGVKISHVWFEGNQADHWRHGFNLTWLLRNMMKGSGTPTMMTIGKRRRPGGRRR